MKLAFLLGILISLTVDGTPFGKKQFYRGYLNFQVPKAVEKFYDKILSNPGTYGQDLSFIKEAIADDWNTRPNPLNPSMGIEAGPFPEGVVQIMGLWSVIFQGVKIERMHTFVLDFDKVAVISRFSATMGNLPPGLTEYPMFPGIDPEKLKGKSFTTLAYDVQILDKGKIRRTWHFEDWTLALDEMLTGRAPANLDWPEVGYGEFLTEVPQTVYDFYKRELSDGLGEGQNLTLLASTHHEDWAVRPNPLNVVEGTGPGIAGLKGLTGLFKTIIPDLIFAPQKTWLHEDKVVVLIKVSGTVAGAPPGMNEIPLWPGIDPEKLKGKKFETLALDCHRIIDGKIKQSYHIEDWQQAADQMLNGKPVPDFGLDEEYLQFSNFGWKPHGYGYGYFGYPAYRGHYGHTSHFRGVARHPFGTSYTFRSPQGLGGK